MKAFFGRHRIARLAALSALLWLCCAASRFPVAGAQPAEPADAPSGEAASGPEAITVYHLQPDTGPVYGVFDIGNKPSVRLLWPSGNAGHLAFTLHGRHYAMADLRPYVVRARFADVTGQVFATSAPVTFDPNRQGNTTPAWFDELAHIAGLYGTRTADLPIPRGTAMIDLTGDLADSRNAGTDMLLGYVSQIRVAP